MGLVNIPNVFVGGNTAYASDVNENFDAIAAVINGNISAANILDGAVTTNKLGTKSVTGVKIADETIISLNLAPNSVTSGKIYNGAILSTKLANNSVLTSKLSDNAVSEAKIAPNAVTSGKIATSAVTSTKIATDAVTPNKASFMGGVTDNGNFIFGYVDGSLATPTISGQASSIHSWTVARTPAYTDGAYRITHSLGLGVPSISLIVMVQSRQYAYSTIVVPSANYFDVYCFTAAGGLIDSQFQFFAIHTG